MASDDAYEALEVFLGKKAHSILVYHISILKEQWFEEQWHKCNWQLCDLSDMHYIYF